MVFLFLCAACERGDHKNCQKGHPAPKGVYGGSKCSCFECAHKAASEKIPNTEIALKDFDGLMDKLTK